ncbi:ribonuclease HI [Actinospica durhamensis]|uniref:Ribonuclease H n=1 Tax=Actinospica durhamensis TaxID=1508375 RepID=A0A941EVZ8_9ACTN|nr:ribonuclease H [Actinospica durhamensis]MBR7836019.1 ribonuclease HI [Actinospica durhamensis]
MTNRVLAACDGACKRNPGPAAWAWVIAAEADGSPGRWAAGALGDATNNIAELTALEQLLSTLDPAVPLEVRMDSQYAMKAVTSWLPGWRKRGWKTASGSPVANRDLVVRIDALLAGRDVKFVYVPAHQTDGDPLNAFADEAASACAVSQQSATGALTADQTRRLAVPAVTTVPADGASAAAKKSSAPRTGSGTASGTTPRSIAAKYPGTCGCGRRYAAGEQIAKGPKGWGHLECAAG